MEMIGRVLGNRYEILEKIGSGGMATVYKARCKLLNRKVAIKILRDEFANDEEFIKRFQIEAQAAASLSHTNIVSIYDVGNEGGMHYIVMELVEGKTLKEIISENKRLPWKDAVKIATQIASGLEQAHKNHIVHRDIKPHNIIMTKDGIAKVTDFGIAKAVSNSTINAYGSTIGSVHYFSPEHARGGYTDEKSDLYSLGVVLYEMVTGKLPFEGDTPVSVALMHLQQVPVEPIKIVPDIPKALNDIIIKSMQKDVNNRYASAGTMINELNRVLKNPEQLKTGITDDDTKQIFSTQKVPIIGIDKQNVSEFITINTKNKKDVEEESMGKKSNGLSKKQAMVRLILFLILAVVLFFGAFAFAVNVIPKILGGNEMVTVPNVTNDYKDEAKSKLEKAGLVMEIEAEVESTELPKGYVISQTYKEGYRLKEGATVGVRISKGAKTVLVPDVTTLTPEAAKIEIEKVGLTYKQEEEPSGEVPTGSITRQSPLVNTDVELGSEVIVYISVGPIEGMVKVPNVVGKSEAEARAELTAANLIPDIIYTEITIKENDTVVSQTPEQDTYATELDKITLVVNKIGGQTIDPNVPVNPSTGETKKITIDLSGKGKRDTFMVKVELQGDIIGSKVAYEAVHSRKDGKINVDLGEVKGTAIVKVYIDDTLDSEQLVK